MAHAPSLQDHGSHEHHVHPFGMYVKTFFALLFFMVLTVAMSFVQFGEILHNEQLGQMLNNIVALTIAIIKMLIVIAFFMHVKYGTKLMKVFAYGGFIWFTLMFFILADYVTRPWEPVEGWEKLPASSLPRSMSPDPAAPNGPMYHSTITSPDKGEAPKTSY